MSHYIASDGSASLPDITAHRGLVVHLARRYLLPDLDLDDLIQEGCIGLLHAARRYDAARGAFSTYAAYWVHKYLRQMHAAARHHQEVLPLSDTLPAPHPESAPPSDSSPRLQHWLTCLEAHERQVLELRYGLNGEACHSVRAAAQALGCSRTRVQQTGQQALARLRQLALAEQDHTAKGAER
jgi:RNA polymerase primary sigma factor